MTKRALIVGINYEGSGNDLKGCINDANNVRQFLEDQEFDEVNVLLEEEATAHGIKSGLVWLTSNVKPGDILLFHYSGHGSQLPSSVEPDGFEEIICPYDLNWVDKVVTDDDLRHLFNAVPDYASINVILDCCHSGTMLDQNESLPTDKLTAPTNVVMPKSKRKRIKDRFLAPPQDIVEVLKTRKMVKWSTSRDINRNALLIAGCEAHDVSADAYIGGSYQGALTAALLHVLTDVESITYRELMTEIRAFMKKYKFTQVPQLDGLPLLYDKEFLDPFVDVESINDTTETDVEETTEVESVDTTETDVEETTEVESVDTNGKHSIIGVVSVGLIAIALALLLI